MEKNEFAGNKYESPKVEIVEVQVEKGFAVSGEYDVNNPTGGLG